MDPNYSKIWKTLEDLGYSRGDDIPYFHFNESCEDCDIDPDDINLEKFSETFDVNIG